jgi:hypothetical protein
VLLQAAVKLAERLVEKVAQGGIVPVAVVVASAAVVGLGPG